MSMLCYLDLSQNAVDDSGACSLAVALENCFIGSSNYHYNKIREAEEKRLLSGEQQSVGSVSGTASIPDALSINTGLNTPISNIASNVGVDNTPVIFMKTFPLRTLVLRANRITEVGATALLNVLEKLTNQLNYSRLGMSKNRNIKDDIDLSVCQVKNELPKWVPDSSLDHILKPNEVGGGGNKTKKKIVQDNFFGLTRPEKKFYPRNPLKKITPAPNPEQIVLMLPLSDDVPQNTFLTSTSKIKAALLPQLSKQVKKTVNHRANAIVPFYLK